MSMSNSESRKREAAHNPNPAAPEVDDVEALAMALYAKDKVPGEGGWLHAQGRPAMTEPFFLTREQRDGLRLANSINALFPEIERIVSEQVEAARADERATQWEAHKRAAALNGVIQRSTAHLRIALGYRDADADAGLESLAVQAKSRAEAAAEAAERALVKRERAAAEVALQEAANDLYAGAGPDCSDGTDDRYAEWLDKRADRLYRRADKETSDGTD